MRHGWSGLAMLVALCAAPAQAANVAGWYAGIYGGSSTRSAAELGLLDFGIGATSTTGTVEAPSSFVNDGGLDPLFFDFLNAGILEFPFSDLAAGFGTVARGPLEFDRALTAGVVIGYRLGNGMRLEIDGSHASFSGTIFSATSQQDIMANGAIDPDGVWTWTNVGSLPSAFPVPVPVSLADIDYAITTKLDVLLVNGFYDFDTGTAFTPYLGGGIGVARVASRLADLCGCFGSASGASIVPAAQLGGGLRVAVAEPVTLDIGYRYKALASPDLNLLSIDSTSSPGVFAGIGTNQSGVIGVHTLQAGLSFALP